ncbi:ergot alkaloid biosynthetic protein B [Metarhizium album ARSEF 1941]|uniref:Ergot alkaloid biosynthetic protein B n=1 Tax=Metarhizium album (strain ARSEF 1941) TaxID=1081103 RepID=A0A0B2X885_METAS|nr:ergot alkaloid biosynthetic protein B [Metarhizium album ARSEF 1941]KHO01710.1 ergot alkaloid biosynthetic protein B [Metarhizium album ARSEF 1941]
MFSPSEKDHGGIFDIGGSALGLRIRERLLAALRSTDKGGRKPKLPAEILYDDEGLKLWGDIVNSKDFYQAADEASLLRQNGEEIARLIRDSGAKEIVDIGAGHVPRLPHGPSLPVPGLGIIRDTRKVEFLLDVLEKTGGPVTYLMLDISRASLQANLARQVGMFPRPDCRTICLGLFGTFEDGQQCIGDRNAADDRPIPRIISSHGSVLCNDNEEAAKEHLKAWTAVLRPVDRMLIGMDGHAAKDEDQKRKIWLSYHPENDLYKTFFDNGRNKLNKLLGDNIFTQENWDFHSELETEPTTRHRNWMAAKKDITCKATGSVIKAGQEFDWFDSHKYGPMSVQKMCSEVGLKVLKSWKSENSEFYLYWVGLYDAQFLEDTVSGVSSLG